ncbi:MAG: sigma-E processing peptidase SpoIIGA [Clostridia bacterium]|nr:sigma-E processing peptidase SpoIIGA [Clostridia bacterium]
MKVYIEYVLIDNFLIDYLLLKATFAITGKPVERKRLFLCAFLGAVFALVLPLVEGVAVLGVLYKLFSGLLIVILAEKTFSFRSFYINALVFFLLTFLAGGAITGVFSILGIDYTSEVSIALMFLPVGIFIKGVLTVVRYFSKRKTLAGFYYDVEITLFDERIKVRGFMDSGNTVYDGVSPVVFVNKKLAKTLIKNNIIKAGIKKIMIQTVAGKTENLAFKLTEIKIYKEGGQNIFNNVTACVADNASFDGYEIILHPALMEELKDDKSTINTQKVS